MEFLDRNHEAGESCLHNFLRNKFWSLFVSRLLKKRQPELRKIDLKVGWHSLIFKMRENIFNLGHGSQVFSTLWVCHYQKDLPVFIFSSFKHFPNKATWVWFPTCLAYLRSRTPILKTHRFSRDWNCHMKLFHWNATGWKELRVLPWMQWSANLAIQAWIPVSGIFGGMYLLIPFRRIFEPYVI